MGIYDSRYEHIRSYMNNHSLILDYTWKYKITYVLASDHIVYSYATSYTNIFDDIQSHLTQ